MNGKHLIIRCKKFESYLFGKCKLLRVLSLPVNSQEAFPAKPSSFTDPTSYISASKIKHQSHLIALTRQNSCAKPYTTRDW